MMEKIIKILRGEGKMDKTGNMSSLKKKMMPRDGYETKQDEMEESPEHEAMESPEEEQAEHDPRNMMSDEEDNEINELMMAKKNKMKPRMTDDEDEMDDYEDEEDEEEPKGKLYGDGHKKMMMKIILGLGKQGRKGMMNEKGENS